MRWLLVVLGSFLLAPVVLAQEAEPFPVVDEHDVVFAQTVLMGAARGLAAKGKAAGEVSKANEIRERLNRVRYAHQRLRETALRSEVPAVRALGARLQADEAILDSDLASVDVAAATLHKAYAEQQESAAKQLAASSSRGYAGRTWSSSNGWKPSPVTYGNAYRDPFQGMNPWSARYQVWDSIRSPEKYYQNRYSY